MPIRLSMKVITDSKRAKSAGRDTEQDEDAEAGGAEDKRR